MLIAVTGKTGQVVTALLERGDAAGVEIVTIGRPELDLANPVRVKEALSNLRVDAIVSAAAYTGVDKAESEPEVALAVNAEGARAVAEASFSLGIPIVHISTDYVFAGDKSGVYSEADATGPVSVYGQSKLAGEAYVAATNPNHVILRTAWVYSPFGSNFLKTMLRLAETRDAVSVVCDQHGTPTSALEIADAVISVVKRLIADPDPELRGVFHLTASGEASWADFAEVIFAELRAAGGKSILVQRISTADYPTPARRPSNSRLSPDKLRRTYGIVLPDWKLSTKVVVDRLYRAESLSKVGSGPSINGNEA